MKRSAIIFVILATSQLLTAQHKTGIFTNAQDIGSPAIKGSAHYDDASKTYVLKGAGDNIWFSHDQFQYAYKKLKGNFVVTASFEFVGKGTNPHRKTGWMIRAAADSDAVHYSAVLHGDGLTVLQWRTAKGAAMRDPEDEIFAKNKNYTSLQLERRDNKLIMSGALAGGQWEVIGTTAMNNIPEEAMVGIFICSHDPKVVEEVKVTAVRIR